MTKQKILDEQRRIILSSANKLHSVCVRMQAAIEHIELGLWTGWDVVNFWRHAYTIRDGLREISGTIEELKGDSECRKDPSNS